MINYLALQTLAVGLWCGPLRLCGGVSDCPLVLLIMMDGFRWDYLAGISPETTPNLRYLAEQGSRARWLTDVFPTVTMPNSMTILTGLYPEDHGIVNNDFYDPELNETFYMNSYKQSFEPKWFDVGSEPIWVTNKRAGGPGRYSGTCMWPCTQAPVKHIPNDRIHGFLFNASIPYYRRVDTVVSWFVDRENPINLGFLYFGDPDNSGHKFGPESVEVENVILVLDSMLGYLMQKLRQHNLFERMNIILVADHGMVEVSEQKLINLDEFVNPTSYQPLLKHGYVDILMNPLPGYEDEVYQNLSNKHPHLNVYRKGDEFLKKKHFSNNSRISELVVYPDMGWMIVSNSITDLSTLIKGQHGFDENEQKMHPFFIAHGPAFKKGYVSEPFSTLDIYPLMCKILELEPAPNSGSLDNVRVLLLNDNEQLSKTYLFTLATYLAVLLFAATVAGLYSIAAIRQSRFTPHKLPWLSHSMSTQKDKKTDIGHRLLNSIDDDDDEEEEL